MSISKEIITVLDDLAKRFGIAIDWADKNVIPYVTELMEKFITYSIVVNCIPIVLLIISLVIWIPILKSYIVFVKTDNNTLLFHKDRWNDSMPTVLGCICLIVNGFLSLFGLIGTGCCVNILIKLICIPELYIIEYVKALL